MKFQSLYYLTDDSIVYQQIDRPSIEVRFSDFLLVRERNEGMYLSKAMNTLLHNEESSLQASYHLAAIHEKFTSDILWDWESTLVIKERDYYEEIAGERAYLKEKQIFRRPEFFDEYGFDEYLGRIRAWAKKRGLFKSEAEILEQTKRKIQELVIARSKTDFIELTERHIQLILSQ